MQWAKQKQPGFTIVELLIVVVVIAILAAITIVAYNGIQNRAKASAAQSAAAQAAKKVALWQVDNPGQSPDQATFDGLVGTANGATYQYSALAGGAFCITATANNTSFFTSGSSPSAGACAGHNRDGILAITNWAINPSAVGSITGFAQAGSGQAPANTSISTVRSHHGTTSLRRDITGSGQTGSSAQTQAGSRPIVRVGDKFSWSFWVYSTKAGSITTYCDSWRVSDGGGAGMSAGTVAVPANDWTQVVATATANVDMYIGQCGGYNLSVVAGDTVWFDEFMLTSSATPARYADGSTSGWVWNGAANASSSTGMAL